VCMWRPSCGRGPNCEIVAWVPMIAVDPPLAAPVAPIGPPLIVQFIAPLASSSIRPSVDVPPDGGLPAPTVEPRHVARTLQR
jgi:hypothetical protein